MSARSFLKDGTEAAHAALDASLSRFDLANRDSYAALLQVHARVLPAVENMLTQEQEMPRWGSRVPLLMQDLAELGRVPAVLMTAGERLGRARACGMLYVVEGSRLGGRMLLRSVGSELPSRFLSAVHGPGEWQEILASIDALAERGGAPWLEGALFGAELGFRLYSTAAQQAGPVA